VSASGQSHQQYRQPMVSLMLCELAKPVPYLWDALLDELQPVSMLADPGISLSDGVRPSFPLHEAHGFVSIDFA
jgi:hypothetical protein